MEKTLRKALFKTGEARARKRILNGKAHAFVTILL
jgi:hypothetical protein